MRCLKKTAAGFLPRYEELLRQAGSDTVENVVQHAVGRNIERPEFWAEAIDSLEEPTARLENVLRELGRTR